MSMFPQSLAHHRGAVGFASGVIVAGLLVGGGAAIAAIPSTATSTYTACANKSTGALRVIDYKAGKRCTSRETMVSWLKGYRYRGTWAVAAVYAPLDVVEYGGSSYLAKLTSKGTRPSSHPTYWGLLAARGDTGAAGPKGAPGPAGEPGLGARTWHGSYSVGGASATTYGTTTSRIPYQTMVIPDLTRSTVTGDFAACPDAFTLEVILNAPFSHQALQPLGAWLYNSSTRSWTETLPAMVVPYTQGLPITWVATCASPTPTSFVVTFQFTESLSFE